MTMTDILIAPFSVGRGGKETAPVAASVEVRFGSFFSPLIVGDVFPMRCGGCSVACRVALPYISRAK